MKLRNLVLVSIFALSASMARSQVFEYYYQGFEATETVNFISSSSANVVYDSLLSASGDRSIKLKHSTSEVVSLITDTLDFTQNTTLHYFALEFDHICNAETNGGGDVVVGKIFVKRPSQSVWEPLTTTNYKRSGNWSDEIAGTMSISRESYEEWQGTTMTNDFWKHERFDLDNKLGSNVPPNDRKLQIKFELARKTSGSVVNRGWWLDNIRLRASQSQMIKPTITMRVYPDGGLHPSSRGARIELVPSTPVVQGIDPDSVYIIYTVGSDPTQIRLPMTGVAATSPVFGNHTKYVGRIPFEGYDTLMRFYCVAKDASTNHNEVTYPSTANSWVEYRCVRGESFPGTDNPAFAHNGSSQDFPFPNVADGRSEWIYDSTMLANAGIKPGGIMTMRYTVAANNTRQVRPKFQIRMKNAPTSYTVNPGNDVSIPFTASYMHIVYDSTLVIDEMGAGSERTINLQDTFFYAGKDIVVQMAYDGTVDMGATKIYTQTAPANKKSLLNWQGLAIYGYNTYTSDDMANSSDVDPSRPVFVMSSVANQPLVYDLGISGMNFPNETNPIVTQPSHLDVLLHNYGVATINAVRISYTIDDTIPGYFDWTGSLAGGAETTVQVLSGLTLPAGYHYVRSWVEDTLTVGSTLWRDHEPYNDTNLTEFIVCAGPMNGVRNIGGANADYNTIEEFLFSLSQCGIDDSLVVRLAPGEYPPFEMPQVSGLTPQHYLVFTSAETNNPAVIKSNEGSLPNLVSLENTPYVRLRNLTMVRTSGPLDNMVKLNEYSTGCRVENCTLIDSIENPTSSMRIGAMINTGFADNVIVSGNTIYGGNVGVDVTGQATDFRAQHNRLSRNIFYNQFSSAIALTNQSNITVEKNELYDVMSNSSYVLRVMNCYDTVRILSNKIYTSHGAQALGVSNAIGTAALPVLIANNMVVCADDGMANQQNTPFNIIQGQWMDVVYNSVKMTAPERNNVAAATFGGGILSNSRFLNNIVTCYDQSNYAFNFMPGTQTSNIIGHNVYYSEGHILNKRTGGSYTTLSGWQAAVEMDSMSVSLNPTFLNGSRVDLRTFNRLVKGVGTPIASVTTDMFDTLRSTTAPCPGAFEFVSLFYDFEPEAMLSPSADNCDMPDNVEMVLVLRNSGTSDYVRTGSLTLGVGYSVNGGSPTTFNVTRNIPHEDTIVLSTGRMLQMPPNGIYDSVFNVKVWTFSPNDPNQTNDTNIFHVVSRYHAVAPPAINDYIPYNTADTIVATGATEWAIYNDPSAPTVPSKLYWYYSPDDTEPFQTGTSYITDILRQDTHFYLRQHREIPIVRITQVQLFRSDTVIGLTDPMPEWIHPNTKVVVQLTNVGDDTAFLNGDTVMFVSAASGANNKLIKFTGDLANVSIAPGASLAIQFHSTNGLTHQLPYMVQVKQQPAINYTTSFAVVYRSGGVQDAVVFNGGTASTAWTNLNVPSYVWSGNGLPLANETFAGVVRRSFNGNSGDWLYSMVDNPMNLTATDPSWLRYTANNCEGDVGVATVHILQPPAADIELEPVALANGCNLGNEEVKVKVHNFGTQAVNNLQLHYTARGVTVNETLTSPIAASADTTYTFLQPINMIVSDDSLIEVKIWSTYVATDPLTENDTCYVSAVASHTPDAPVFGSVVTFTYATSDTLSIEHDSLSTPVWYDYDGNRVGMGGTYITDILYNEGDMAVSYIHHKDSMLHIGTQAALIGKTAYPCPYQPNNKNSKQQFIYSASDLRSMGALPGAISGVSFHLDSIWNVNSSTRRDSVVFDSYSIAIGFTSDTVFANATAWKTAQVVYSRTNMPVYRSSTGDWVDHVFDTPVIWDGQQSIVVQVVSEIATAITTGVQTAYTAKPNTTLHKAQNTAVGEGFTGSGTKGNNRPDIRFLSKVYGCEGPSTPFHIALEGVPQTDATMFLPESALTAVYSSCGDIDLDVCVRNMGRSTIHGYQLHYSVDGAPYDTLQVTDSLVPGQLDTVTMFSLPLMPGHHRIVAAVAAADDSVSSNDTVRTGFNVRFCSGDYTIGHETAAEYHSIMEAVDTLQVAGIDGPVVFHISGGLYEEKVLLGPVEGSSVRNSITFRGSSDSAVVVRAVTANQSNYVVNVDSLSNVIFDSMTFISRPASGNYGHVVVLQNCSNITFTNSTICVKSTINANTASGIMLQGNVDKLILRNNVLDSGYYSVGIANNTTGYSGFIFQNNNFQNFHYGSIDIKNITGINISSNTFTSGYKSRQVGIGIEDADSTIVIQKNKIYLIGALTGPNSVIDGTGKRGIYLKNVSGTNQQWVYIANNMIGVSSNGTSGVDPAGIYVDGTSSYINVYYNSIRVYGGATDVNKTKAFASTANTHHLQVMNNIFSNFSKGYAYHVASSNNISASDYNAYFAAGEKFASWGGAERADLAELQTAANRDGSSLDEEPYFAADDDLHLLMTNFVARAQYNTDVVDDIDGTIRSQMPAPTIGAHEMERENHNMSVVRIIEPTMPVSVNAPNNVESDTMLVKATFYNNGNATENNVRWRAYVVGHENEIYSVQRNLGTFASGQMKTDSVYMPTILGIIDTQTVRVELFVNSDDDTTDNHMDAQCYLAPAFNLEAVRLTVPQGCSLQHSQISITLKNVGFKAIPEGVTFEMGYHAQGYTSISNNNFNANKLNIATMPDTVREYHTFLTPLARNSSRDFVFDSLANLYPTDTALNIKVRVNGWCRYEYDVTFTNDSTGVQSSSSPQVNSYYTPDPPFGFDTTFDYGTWGVVRAEQNNSHTSNAANMNHRPIRWYRDSTAAPFYSDNNYNNSCKWQTTPQFFHDSTYYLQCFSHQYNCPSYFSEVHVSVAPRKANDMAIEQVLAPLGSRVFMENDTVRVRVTNFGTVSQSNIPVTYQVRHGNNQPPLVTVTETIPGPVASGQTVDYTFDSLIYFSSALQATNYQLRAWTDLANDEARRNDTIRYAQQLRPAANNNTSLDYTFRTLGNNYYQPTALTSTGFVFTRISFNEIDVDMPPLGRFYTNFGDFSTPEYPVLRIRRGMTDSLIYIITKSDTPNERTRGKVAAWIDYDRSGTFEDNEAVLSEYVANTNEVCSTAVTIPSSASYGYMKMRMVTCNYEATANPSLTSGSENMAGHMVDFLVYVEPEPPAVDVAFTQIVNPRSYLIRDHDTLAISFRVANKGTQPLTQFTVNYRFISDSTDSASIGSFQWRGNSPLMGGTTTIITLPPHYFPTGTTRLTVWHDLPGDTITTNNILSYEYHRFHTVYIRVNDNFDSLNYWYAPVGYNNYSRNYWQWGTPHKNIISAAFSEPKAWVTDTANIIMSGTHGNVSYLYSPIIDISQIRSDTISFRLLKDLLKPAGLSTSSSLRLEYYDYENNWTNLVDDTMMADNSWYNDADNMCFNEGSTGNAYNRYWARTSGYFGSIGGNFNEKLQFRFVYTTPIGTNASTQFGEGCAIDDFRIGRAQRAADIGVVAVTKPTMPKYGQTVYPEVVVKNFGYDTCTRQQLGYTYYGTTLAVISSYDHIIPPGETDTFLFTSPFVITSDFPDTFYINAFTIWNADLYNDNDTATQMFHLSPLDDDISAEEFLAPLDRVIAGDSTCSVTMRIQNFGMNPIDSATLTYIVNDDFRVTESVDFNQVLGRPLQSTEFFNYTFREHFLASMGMMRLVGIVKCENNEYIYNDTINKRFNGISSITDLAANSIIVDSDQRTTIKVALIIDNRGARGANGFEVGFWIDNDTNTMYRSVYSSELPIPALTTGYFLFDSTLSGRSAPYDHVSAYVHVEDDNDRTNDTTSLLVSKYVDLEAVELVVEENAGPDCRAFLRIRNLGNIAFDRTVRLKGTINGNELTRNISQRIEPMRTALIEFTRTIPKDPQRHYYGSGQLTYGSDADTSNNQTSVVRVVNYIENVPEVGAGSLVLDQNFPNPFTGRTTIPFTLPNASDVTFFVMDALGHIVFTEHGYFAAGNNSITLDMDQYTTGVYYYGIEVDGVRQMRKMIVR